MHINHLALLFVLLSYSFAVNSKEHVVLGINSSTSKGFYYQDNKLKGEYGSQLQCVIDELDIEFDKQVLPVARLVASLESGMVDAAVGLARTNSRDRIGRYSEPVMKVPYTLINGATDFKSNEDIKNKSIAVLRSSNMVPMAMSFGGKPHELSNYQQVVQMVISKRVDGAIVPENVFTSLTKAQQQKLVAKTIKEETVSFYISLKSEHLDELMLSINGAISICLAKP